MWICIRCDTELSADQAPPNIDDIGLHFICPNCSRRNQMKRLGEDKDGFAYYEQPPGRE